MVEQIIVFSIVKCVMMHAETGQGQCSINYLTLVFIGTCPLPKDLVIAIFFFFWGGGETPTIWVTILEQIH